MKVKVKPGCVHHTSRGRFTAGKTLDVDLQSYEAFKDRLEALEEAPSPSTFVKQEETKHEHSPGMTMKHKGGGFYDVFLDDTKINEKALTKEEAQEMVGE
jgi:hypothetical protein